MTSMDKHESLGQMTDNLCEGQIISENNCDRHEISLTIDKNTAWTANLNFTHGQTNPSLRGDEVIFCLNQT